MSSSDKNLIESARAALSFSYSPYSEKKIGASLLLSNGMMYSGTNIENASYGATVCAERVAIWKAYSENPHSVKIEKIVVASEAATPWPPCGMCRQVISEFATPETQVCVINLSGVEKKFTFNELFPESFGPEHFLK